jgi:hypothetical protein
MKHQFLLLSCFLLICLNTSCKKASQVHLMSANTWVVTEVSSLSNFAKVGDELTFLDNRLFFKFSNGLETDGKWDFSVPGRGRANGLSLSSDVNLGFGFYYFAVNELTDKKLDITDVASSFTIHLKAKE